MTVLVVAVVLAFVSVATVPCWSYSAGWSHLPSAIAGTLLFCVAILVIGGKSAPKAPEPDLEVASASPMTSAYNAFRRRIETVSIEPENAFQ